MRENEFEKKMQEKMEELKLRPSEAVWPNVEMELKRKKRRRVIFYLFLLAGLGLAGYSGYNLWNTDEKTELARQNKESEKQDQLQPGNNQNQNLEKSPVIEKSKPEIRQAIPGKEIIKAEIKSHQIVQAQPSSVHRKQLSIVKDSKGHSVPGKPTTETDNYPEEIIAESKTQENNVAIVSSQNESLLKDSSLVSAETVKNTVLLKDSALAIAPAEVKPAVKEDSLQQAMIGRKKSGSKIKFGFDLSAGSSSRRDKLISLPAEKALRENNVYSAPLSSNAGRIILPPSSVRAGFSGKIGVVAELEINRRNHFSAGLRYAYLSESIKIGSYNDTVIFSNSYSFAPDNAVNGVYRSPQQQNLSQNDYKNQYHFIELPMLYQLQLNKGNKVPILWNIGIAPSYLISTNALLYDTAAGGVYYHDKKAFNRLHVSAQSGFSFVFGSKKRMQWSVGPEFSLDMVRLLKQDMFTKNRYIMYGGISGRIFLKPPKK